MTFRTQASPDAIAARVDNVPCLDGSPVRLKAQVVDGSSEVLNGLQLAAVYGPYFSVTYGPAHHLTLQPPPGRVDSND